MWFEQIVRRETGCAAYVIGSSETSECAVFDPLWDPAPYLAAARRYRSRIRYVIDSHSHADHVSGARRLAAATGAELILHELAELTYEARRVKGGDLLDSFFSRYRSDFISLLFRSLSSVRRFV